MAAPELIPAFIPPILSSKIIQFFGSNPISFAANINISGEGFPFLILLSSPNTIASKVSLIHSFLLKVLKSKLTLVELVAKAVFNFNSFF